ncbi:GNAT family N-acetyltransferase [Streptomyces sp. NBC_00267]
MRKHMMEIEENTGLPMVFASTREALETDWEEYRGRAEVVRVVDPAADAWPRLRAAGFLPKPSWLTWVADTGESEEAYLSGLHRKERQSIQAARRRLDEAGLTVDVVPVTEPFLDEFLDLYERQLTRLRHALPVALQQRDQLLSDAADLFAVKVRDGDALTGACLSQDQPEADLVRLRFSAVNERARAQSLARVLYTEAVNHARDRGFGRVSLGNDPNLYGHVVEVGLFAFKTRLGFSAVPSQTVHPFRGDDCADLVLSRRVLTDPTLLLSYREDAGDAGAGSRGLRMELFASSADPEAGRYAGSFTGEIRVHTVPSADPDPVGP